MRRSWCEMLQIRKGTHIDLEKYYGLIENDFDERELISKIPLHKAVMQNYGELLIFFDDDTNEEIGYAFVLTKNIYKYTLLKYFAILPWCQEKGYGTKALELLIDRYSESRGLIAEVPKFEENDIEQLKGLFRFFAAQGFVAIRDEYYISKVPTVILIKGIRGTANISPVYKHIMDDFYSRIFLLGNTMISYWQS